MLKTSAYTFLLVVAGSLLGIAALVIPQVSLQEQEDDLQDDLLRAERAVQSDLQLLSFRHVSAARTLAMSPAVQGALPAPPSPDELTPAPPAADPALAFKNLPREQRWDLLALVDRRGQLLTLSGASRPEVGQPIQGLPGVQAALDGIASDAVWVWPEDRGAWLVAASPVVVWSAGGPRVEGVVIVGTQLDSSVAASLAQPLRASNRPAYSFDVALLRDDHIVATSIVDAELDAWANNLAMSRGASLSSGDGAPLINVAALPESKKRVGASLSALGAKPGRATLGVSVIAVRPAPTQSPLALFLRAFEGGLPPELLVHSGIIALCGLGLFLIAIVLISLEHAAPGRRLHRALLGMEADAEQRNLELGEFHGVYRDAARSLLTVLTILRKRLERERALNATLGGDAEAPEASSLPPAASLTPAPVEAAKPALKEPAPAEAPRPTPAPPAPAAPELKSDVETTMDIDAADYARFIQQLPSLVPTPEAAEPATAPTPEPEVPAPSDEPAQAAITKGIRKIPRPAPEPVEAALFASGDPDNSDPTQVAGDEESFSGSGDFSVDSSSALSSRSGTGEGVWRKTDQPLTPQSLLGQLKQRAVVPPKRRSSTATEDTQVKQVNPDLLRRSSEHAAPKLETALPDEFAQLFDEFVTTKSQCNEPLDGLTFERFMGRIERNRAKLLEQYQCRDVKFSVYVKGGKAALKATPVK